MQVTDQQAEILARLHHGEDIAVYLDTVHLDGLVAAGFVTSGDQPDSYALTEDGVALARDANVPA